MPWGQAHQPTNPDVDMIAVPRDFLVRVDSYTSLATYRGLDNDLIHNLKTISAEARRLYQPAAVTAMVDHILNNEDKKHP